LAELEARAVWRSEPPSVSTPRAEEERAAP
jgi:hypothetical protein